MMGAKRYWFWFGIVFAGAMLLLPSHAVAQSHISVRYDQQPLKQVLTDLTEKHQIIFSYVGELVEAEKISVEFANLDLDKALAEIFGNTSVDFQIINQTFVVLGRKKEITPERSICGTIVDEQGAPLPFATIFVDRTKQGDAANEVGEFAWRGSIGPTDTIEISYVGFQPTRMAAAALVQCPTIVLSYSTFSFAEVIVKEYVTTGIDQAEELDHLVLRPDQLGVIPGFTEPDILQMAQMLPGIQSPDESATGLHIRGGTPDQNLILWDGIPVYNAGHFFGMLSAFNPHIVDSVNVYRSSFGAEFGGRVGGVIDIWSTHKIPEKTIANFGINFTQADAAVTVPFGGNKAAITLSGRRAFSDILQTPTFQSISGRVFQEGRYAEFLNARTDPEERRDLSLDFTFNDVNFKWLYQPNPRDKFSVSAFGIFDDLQYTATVEGNPAGEVDQIAITNIGWSAQWQRNWHARFASLLRVTMADFSNEYQITFGEPNQPELVLTQQRSNSVVDRSIFWNNQWSLSDDLEVDFGYQYSGLSIGNQFNAITLEGANQTHATFLNIQLIPDQHWKINGGLRLSLMEGVAQPLWEPRFTLFYLPSRHWQVRLSSGSYRQIASQAVELNDLGFNEQYWVLPSRENGLQVGRNLSHALGFLFDRSGLQIELEGYWRRLRGLPARSTAFLNATVIPDELAGGNGKVLGADLLLKKRWGVHQTWVSYSFMDINYQYEGLNGGQPFTAPQERPHSLTIAHALKIKGWQFSASWQYATGKVYTAAEDARILHEDLVVVYPETGLNEARLPTYHRLDASILFHFGPEHGRTEGTIGCAFQNLYNRENLMSRQYVAAFDPDTEDLGLEVIDRPLLGFTPNLVFRWAWR